MYTGHVPTHLELPQPYQGRPLRWCLGPSPRLNTGAFLGQLPSVGSTHLLMVQPHDIQESRASQWVWALRSEGVIGTSHTSELHHPFLQRAERGFWFPFPELWYQAFCNFILLNRFSRRTGRHCSRGVTSRNGGASPPCLGHLSCPLGGHAMPCPPCSL